MGRVLGLTFIAQLIIQLQGLIVMPIILRWAGPATYGGYTILFVTTIVFFELATSAISYPYIRNLVSAVSPVERRRLFEPQMTFSLAVLSVISFALLLAWPVKMEVGTGASLFTILLVGVLSTNLVQRQTLDYFQYTLRFVPYSIILGGPPLMFMVLLTANVALQRIPSLDTLLVLQCAAGMGVSLPFAVKMFREIGFPRLHLPLRTLMRNMRDSLPVTLDWIVTFALAFGDRYLISLFLSVAAVGHYQPSYQAAAIVFFFARLMADVLAPMLPRMIDIAKRAEAERLVTDFLQLFLMIAIPFTVGMLMVGPSFLALLTTADIAEAGRWVMPLVAAAVTINGFVAFMRAVSLALGRLTTLLISRSAGAIVNVLFNLFLLPIFRDITVSAISALAGYAITGICLAMAFRSTWRLPFELVSTMRSCAAAAIMGAVLWGIGYRPATVAPESVLHLGISVGSSIVIYFAALSALGGFGRRELAHISAAFQKRAPASP